MAKNTLIGRDSRSGQFVSKPLGKSKASRFSLVEGISLNDDSKRLLAEFESTGRTGASLRKAISGAFSVKRK
jgi:hypothetical protein